MLKKSDYSRRYQAKVIDYFDGRTRYDNDATIRQALPLLAQVPLVAGQRVLDIATGTGIIAIAAAQQVGPIGTVVGVDFSVSMLAQAQRKISDLGLENIELLEADVEQVNFGAANFDTVFCSSALVYLTDIPGALEKWYRWLKPGGTVAFSAWSEQSHVTPIIIEVCKSRGIELLNINAPTGTVNKCTGLLKKAGFEQVRVVSEQQGHYASLERASRWDGQWFHPTQNALEGLSEAEISAIAQAYAAAVEASATEQGIWCEKEAFYVMGQKPKR
ncbi:MAG: methyltransferase domain-containing protein [Phormidesmis sp.]